MNGGLDPSETRAIRALERLARTWPQSLWLFAAGERLRVMRLVGGERAITSQGGVDPDYIVADITIPCDGGDW